ncbi:serine threonine protein kinase CMGC group [Saxophila tyrrhenica]|uniref:Serine threonine protein kinase CMGC group n=1 Tax=Saxophila tyrrhenica TaxID=1690608 RepID=A0AAV9P692_9PEZI|nr:serine threonine protein kinase CMGC group [Saxophila tyrrhenica]
MSNGGYTHSHAHNSGQARAGAEYSYTNGLSHQTSHEELKRTNSAASQRQRQLPPPPQSQSSSRAPAEAPPMPQKHSSQLHRDESATAGQKRGRKSPVDWVEFFGGKPPAEIITIHDDDSPAPQAEVSRLPPPTNDTTTAHHVDKRRRTNAAGGDATYSATNTPYSYSNGASTESLQAPTTAPTSLGSQVSSSSKLDATQTGSKRKRTGKAPEQDRKKQELERPGPKGYLAEYGEYVPPPKLAKKQKEVHVPAIHDRHKTHEPIDDEDGHYIVQENSRLGERYSLLQLLGQGTFGKVVKALDIRTRREVAVKIIRAVPKYRDASRIELRVLQTLRTADEQNRNRCIQLRDCFDWRGHICIVTPLLGLSVFDFLKSGGFVPFPGSHIQAFARQLLGSIAFLHDLNLIHTDLKPENILLLNHTYQTFTYNRNIPSSSTLTARSAKFRRVLLNPQINLIDFGSATFNDEYHSSVVSTRHYRAPEIILGIGWSHPIDLWSLGCILVECYTGDALFQTHDCAEHLAMMQAVTSTDIDKSLIREVNRTKRDRNSAARFFKNNRLAYPLPDTPRQSRKFVRSMKKLEETIVPTNNFNKLFLDLLRKIFVYDPKKRITAREALKHPWFDELVEDDGTEAARIKEERERVAAAKAAAKRG